MKLKNHTVVSEDLEDRFPESVDNKCSFASQESLSCDPQCSLKSTPSFSTGAEYKQISDWLHCCKTFQLLPDLNDQNNMVLPEEQFAFPMHLSFSPVKHACEVPEGRQVANLTPIILSRGVKPLKSHL